MYISLSIRIDVHVFMQGSADWFECDRYFSFLALVCLMTHEVWIYVGLDMLDMSLLLSIFAIIFYASMPISLQFILS